MKGKFGIISKDGLWVAIRTFGSAPSTSLLSKIYPQRRPEEVYSVLKRPGGGS